VRRPELKTDPFFVSEEKWEKTQLLRSTQPETKHEITGKFEIEKYENEILVRKTAESTPSKKKRK
jgi:hypothetical protein